MFKPGEYHLFDVKQLEQAFASWDLLLTRHDSFAAPEGTRKGYRP